MGELGRLLYGRECSAGEARHVRGVVQRLEARGVAHRTRRAVDRSTSPPRWTMVVWLPSEHLDTDLPGSVPKATLQRLADW